MKKVILAFCMLVTIASADFIRVQVGTGVWSPKMSGKAHLGGNVDYDVANAYGLDGSSTNSYFWGFIKHPIPIVPNLRIEKTNFATDGKTKQLTIFNSKIYLPNSKSNLVLNQNDFTFYYNILDNTFWTTLDLGINIKQFDGYMSLTDNAGTEEKSDIKATIPMAYARGRVQIPMTGLAFEVDTKFISYDGSSISDTRAKIDYDFFNVPGMLDLGIEVGQRIQKVTLDSSSTDIKTDFEISGMFLGLNGKF